MKKKLLSILIAVFILLPCLLLTGCIGGGSANLDDMDFRVQDGYVQYTTDGKEWQNLISTEDLKGEQGLQGTPGDDADVWTIGNDGYWYRNGNKTNNKATGDVGAAGNGIKSIVPSTDPTKTNTSQTTYIITLDNNSTYEFVVKNGEKGEKGDTGIGEQGEPGKDATYATYTITYDYGAAKSLFKTTQDIDTIKSTEWLITLPEIKDEYKTSFLGWFIAGTGKKIEKYDFVGGNCTLEAKFNIEAENCLSGIYQDGKYVKTWEQIVADLPNAFVDDEIVANGEYSFFMYYVKGELVVDNSIKSIGDYAFSGCLWLTSVIIPNCVTNIGDGAFIDCIGLTSILIPNSVTSIGISAFRACYELTSVVIGSSVACIGKNPFGYCYELTSIIVESGNTVYDNRENCNAIIETATNTLIAGCKNTIIPNSVVSIDDYAFSGCLWLTSVIIPNCVTNIGDGAFIDCIGLTSIVIPNSVASIGISVFRNCKKLTSVDIDSETISNSLQAGDSNGYVINYAQSVYIKTGLEISSSTYLLENFTKQTTSDKAGYDMYVRNS